MIIFMVIAPTQSVGIPALVPQPSTSDGQPIDPSKYIVLSIEKRKAIRLNTKFVVVEDLGTRLTKARFWRFTKWRAVREGAWKFGLPSRSTSNGYSPKAPVLQVLQ